MPRLDFESWGVLLRSYHSKPGTVPKLGCVLLRAPDSLGLDLRQAHDLRVLAYLRAHELLELGRRVADRLRAQRFQALAERGIGKSGAYFRVKAIENLRQRAREREDKRQQSLQHDRVSLFFPPEFSGEPRLADRIGVDHVAGERSGGAAHVEPVDLQRVKREVVAVRLVAHRRARAAPPRAPAI